MKKGFSTKKIAGMAMLTTISIVLVLLIRLPLIPAAPFLEYDPADIPIFLGTFMYGPFAGFILTVIVSVIQGTTVSAATGGPIGILMHICATGIYVIVAGLIYKRKRTFKGAVLAIICGSIVMVAVMIVLNIIMMPIFLKIPRQYIYSMILPAILPFNLIKAAMNSFVTLVLYKQTHRFFNFILGEEIRHPKVNAKKEVVQQNSLPDEKD